jgi:hypothetical protein
MIFLSALNAINNEPREIRDQSQSFYPSFTVQIFFYPYLTYMNPSEGEYIARCKRLIEEKFHLQSDQETLRQRDLEYLADQIEEKSGIKLSLSTLKRVWKKDYDQNPHPSTLQALVSVLGYKDWQDFKLRQAATHVTSVTTQSKSRHLILRPWLALPVLAALAALVWLIAFRPGQVGNQKPIVKGPVIFTGNKTVSKGVPSTIIFNYDVSNIEADSFFFQQAWNKMEKVRLDPKGHYYSNIYYYPGFHKAKLIANDSVIKRFRIHIITDGWLPLVRRTFTDNMPVHVKTNLITDGTLHTTRKDIEASNLDNSKDFLLSYFNVRDFDNTYSDNFSLDTRIKCDSGNTIPCPAFQLTVICEENIFFVTMTGKGCERNIAIQMGEVYRDGTNSDLSAFGRNLYNWQNLRIQVAQKRATIFLDDQPVYTTTYKNDFGKVVGLVYNFEGTGAVDYVKLKNGENKFVFDDEFDK